MDRPFDFSVITAVYNAKPFLPETVQSLTEQTFAFSRVQLILIDDGSTDGSAAMCDAYQNAHPDNVVVVHKENGGVSSARNEGLKRAAGKYVSFLDADDKLAPNALTDVFAFFEAHPETDVVSLPMIFFDGEHGDHLLNFKYRSGSRVIDLDAEPFNPQLAVTSAFVRAEALKGKAFDTRLRYAEDAKLLQSILIERRKLGVVSTAVHWYRRRSQGEASAIQQSGSNAAWYLPYLNGFCKDTFDLCEARFGTIPRFVQNTVAYDLQWRICQQKIPSAILNEAQKEAYRSLIFSLIARIDDDILARQASLLPCQRAFLLARKHGTLPQTLVQGDHFAYRYGDGVPVDVGGPELLFDFWTVQDGFVTVECSALTVHGFDRTDPEIFAEANGAAYMCKPYDRCRTLFSMDLPMAEYTGYVFRIPVPEPGTALHVRFFRRTEAGTLPVTRIECGQFFPISEVYEHSYAEIGRRVLTVRDGVFTLSAERRGGRLGREARLLRELWKRNKKGGRNAIVGRLVYTFVKPLIRKPIWLLSDRKQIAGDNGEALFRYLSSLKRKPMHPIFAVSDRSADYAALKKVGRVVAAQSFRHKLLFLLSDLNISSHADSDVITQFSHYDEPYRDIQSRIRFVFLQHGVIKDDLSGWLNRYSCNISGFVTSAKPEADSIRSCAYFYPDEAIWLTGLPRFDRLYHDEKRCITIMPTWRRGLCTPADPKTGVRSLVVNFEESEFYRFYNRLLNDERLLAAAKTYGYGVRFLPHPTLHPHTGRFTQNADVTFLPADVPYRRVFAESDLILTDYSSVVFDFAYLRKPVLYTQFDREAFFSGEHVYVQGYFDYERDGFGEVETTYDRTVDRLIEYMQNGCKLKDAYRARIDAFFAFDDRENCLRVYEKLLKLQQDLTEAKKRRRSHETARDLS